MLSKKIYTTIIFDLDGTIINSEGIWRNATRALLLKRAIKVTDTIQDEVDRLVRGRSIYECCSIIKNHFDLSDQINDLMREESELVMSFYDTDLTFIDGFVSFYETIQKAGFKMAVATNAQDDVIDRVNKVLNLDHFFGKHIYGISQVHNVAKPFPDIFLYAALQVGSSPQECVIIEDSKSGIQAARAAGMKCIAINTSGMKHLLHEADHIVDSFGEIVKVLF